MHQSLAGRDELANQPLIIGIDATNLRRGGGLTHLIELLGAAEPDRQGIIKVLVWGGAATLSCLGQRPWLQLLQPAGIDRGLMHRILWQRFRLPHAAREAGCHLLFVPGGSYAGTFRPMVTMNRNLLPFEMRELRRFGWSLTTLRLLLLRWIQARTLRGANGVVFLTHYAQDCVMKVTGSLSGLSTVIPHGLNDQFRMRPRDQGPISDYSFSKPYRLLYVSIVDRYKHQWHLVDAVAMLRHEGLPIVLDLVGPAEPSALQRLTHRMAELDPAATWVRYHGAQPYPELHRTYAAADLGVFASSCETFAQIVVEMMSAGLPIACSSRAAMPELLGDAAIYFDPEQPEDIARALRELISAPQLRAEKAQLAFRQAQQFSWQRCANETFSFLAGIARPLLAGSRPPSDPVRS